MNEPMVWRWNIWELLSCHYNLRAGQCYQEWNERNSNIYKIIHRILWMIEEKFSKIFWILMWFKKHFLNIAKSELKNLGILLMFYLISMAEWLVVLFFSFANHIMNKEGHFIFLSFRDNMEMGHCQLHT